MYKKALAVSLAGFLAFFVVAALSISHRALADQGENGDSSHMVSQDNQESDNEEINSGNTAMSVSIQDNGDFQISGATVNTVDPTSNSVNASLYGFSKTVSLSGAAIMGGGKTISVSDIQTGDKLSASGNFNQTTHVITVSQVNDVSYRDRHNADIQAQISHLLDLVHQLQAQLEALGGH